MKAFTKREILRALKREIYVYHSSYREADGTVRDPEARRMMAALQAAAKIVRRAKLKEFE